MSRSLLLLFLTIPIFSHAQPALKENSIGLAYLDGFEGPDRSQVIVKIVFPIKYLDNYDQSWNGRHFTQTLDLKIPNVHSGHLLVDSTGTFDFETQFWCENDVGIEYRPTLFLKIDIYDFPDHLLENEMQDLLGIVIANQRGPLESVAAENLRKSEIYLDSNDDSVPEAIVWTEYDDAENCAGEPKNNLIVFLTTALGNFWMRCCGP